MKINSKKSMWVILSLIISISLNITKVNAEQTFSSNIKGINVVDQLNNKTKVNNIKQNNKIIDFTIENTDKTLFMRTENVAIPINEVEQLTVDKLKQKMNSQVWKNTNGKKEFIENTVDDDLLSSQVTVDDNQFMMLKNSIDSDTKRPYPIDLTLNTDEGILTKRTWVFILKENDKTENDLVMYADDLSVPAKNIEKLSETTLLKQFSKNISVYIFSTQAQDVESLTPLTQANLDGQSKGLTINKEELKEIKKTKESKIIDSVSIQYKKDDKIIETSVKASIDNGNTTFNLLRNKNEVKIVDFMSTSLNANQFKSFEIRIPKNMSIDNYDTLILPSQWYKYKNSSTDSYDSYGFALGNNNTITVIKSFLENNLVFSLNKDVDQSGQLELIFHEQIYTSYDHPDGKSHYYSFIPTIMYYNNAYNMAKQMTYKGLTGYLATITSEEEHNFIFNNIAKKPGWLGGSRVINSATKQKINDNTYFPESFSRDNEWYWVNGPEAGTVFFTKPTRASGGVAPTGVYDGWTKPGEPNNSGNIEDSLQFALNNSKYWNDIETTRIDPRYNSGYFVEFSEYGSQKELEFDDKDVLSSALIPQRIVIKGKDTADNLLSEADVILEDNIKIGDTVTYTPKTITDYDYVKTTTTNNKKVGLTFTISDKVQNYDSTYRANAKFCFKLERNKEILSFVDLTLDSRLSKMYKSMSIEVPDHVLIDNVPSTWTRLPENTGTGSTIYRFNMKGKNSVSDIQAFLDDLTFKMDTASNPTNTDKPGTIKITLQEEEQLSDSKSRSLSKERIISASSVISKGDFELSAKSEWDPTNEVNYVDLDWDEVPNLSNSGYSLYQSEDGSTWNTRSLNYNKAIKVLNIYPDDPASNTLKTWMDGLGLTDSDGNNLIQVIPVSITNYNANPDSYLKNASGDYQYDVLMFGSWDTYSGNDLNQNSYQATRNFSNSGRGILFGHDTLYNEHPYFMKFSEDIGVTNVRQGTSVLDSVQVINNGYMVKYPFKMENAQILTIPPAHSVMNLNENKSQRWMKFTKAVDGNKSSNPNWYLATNENVGMIQTGHSNGQSTKDERRIIANTLYNLAQVSFDNSGQDYTVKDDQPPTITSTKRDLDNKITIDSVDAGKKYQYYVTADTKDKGELKSDIVETEVISDLKGYIYIIDNNSSTVPPVVKDAYGKVTNITAPVVNPDADRSITIGGVSKESEWLHIIPVDRSNNVGEVKHIQIKDIEYEDDPTQTSCQHNIPQKVYIKGKDTFGKALTSGDQTIDTKLRINKVMAFTPETITNYEYIKLQQLDGTVISPETFTIGVTKQDAEAIYRRKSAKIHIRQEVVNPNDTVVIPKQGHASLLGSNLGTTKTNQLSVPFNSSDQTDQAFTEYDIEIEDDQTLLTVKDIVPMYYDLKGYVATTTNSSHKVSQATTTFNPVNLNDYPEVWVTVYVEPSVKDSAFYGWMYGQNGQYIVK